MNWKLILFIAVLTYGGIKHFNQSISEQQFIVTADVNNQHHIVATDAAASGDAARLNSYQIKALEPFEMHARVLSSKHYTSDREADLAPVDLALGWGPMADMNITNQIQISQSNRWYHWHAKEFPIPRRDIEKNSANMHLIPSTPAILQAIQTVQAGQMVQFTGELVEVIHPEGWRWKSSLTRNDTGAGACELVLVKSFSVL